MNGGGEIPTVWRMRSVVSAVAVSFAAVVAAACGSEKGQEAAATVTVTVVATTDDGPDAATVEGEPPEAADDAAVAEVVPAKTGVSQGDGREIGYGIVLENRSANEDALDVTVTVNILDAAGDVIATEAERINVIPAGETFYLGGASYGDERTRAVALETIVDVGSSEPAAYPLPQVTKVTVTRDEFLGYRVRGEVVNNLDQPLSSFAKIGIVLFDERGEVVGGGFTFLDAELPPGRRAGFEAGNGISAAPGGRVSEARASVNNEVTPS